MPDKKQRVYLINHVIFICLLISPVRGHIAQNTSLAIYDKRQCCYGRDCCDMCVAGCQQSPININVNAAIDTDLPPLRFVNHWASDICLTMSLVGETVLIKPPSECRMSMDGGPLSGSYILDQLHFHWGDSDFNGTEHCLNGNKYAMEAHLVYFNCFYGCVGAAIGQPDGIAIIAVILESKPTCHNCHLDPVIHNLCRLVCPGSNVSLKKNVIKMFKDIMESQEYLIYEGSLTTPPCCEQVLWMVFKNFICIHCSQVIPFRKLCDCCGQPICKNWRKTQPLNGRTVYNARATTCPCSKKK